MTIQSGQIYKVISSAISLTFVVFAMVTAVPAQAGGYLHFGYGHHDEHHGYGHHYYAYGYPLYYGLHSYYGHHYYGHHYYGHHYGGYGYPYYGHHYGGYSYPYYGYRSREPYESDYGNSSSRYDNRSSRSLAAGNGWTLLGNNHASAALTDFGRQAQASPSKGGPKVGYALASADLGRLNKGVWAMRRALRIDPESLHYVALDQHMDAKVAQIIRQYEKKMAYSGTDTDAAFMLASLHYLRRNMEAARSNIDQAMQARRISTSTKNLRGLIDKRLIDKKKQG